MAVINQCQGSREVQAPFSEMLLTELMIQSLLNLLLSCSSVCSQPSLKRPKDALFPWEFIWLLCNCCSSIWGSCWADEDESFIPPVSNSHSSPHSQSDLYTSLLLWLGFLFATCYLWSLVAVSTFNAVYVSWWLVDVWNLVGEEWRSNHVSAYVGGLKWDWRVGCWVDF